MEQYPSRSSRSGSRSSAKPAANSSGRAQRRRSRSPESSSARGSSSAQKSSARRSGFAFWRSPQSSAKQTRSSTPAPKVKTLSCYPAPKDSQPESVPDPHPPKLKTLSCYPSPKEVDPESEPEPLDPKPKVLACYPSPPIPPESTKVSGTKPQRSLLDWCITLVLTLTLLTTGGIVVGGFWVAAQLILDPDADFRWLHAWLPERTATTQQPQTLPEIQAEVRQLGYRVADPIDLGAWISNSDVKLMLLPIVQPNQNCPPEQDLAAMTLPTRSLPITIPCGYLTELRVYQGFPNTGRSPQYELLDRVAVSGPEEFQVVAPFLDSASGQGSSRALPLNRISLVPYQSGNRPPGTWFHLTGQWQQGNNRAIYGQTVRYDADRQQLTLPLQWNSPAEQLPVWQAVIEGDWANLVVDQHLGLDPQFAVYQFHEAAQFGQGTLEAIALTVAAMEQPRYQRALLLARSGLWTPAGQQMQQAQLESNDWPPLAQAQQQVIALHAEVTRQQAEQDWATAEQQLTALLLDGRWTAAWQFFQDQAESGQDLSAVLANDEQRFWSRIETALRVDPNEIPVQIWGAVYLTIQHSQVTALDWIQELNSPTGTTVESSDISRAASIPAPVLTALDWFTHQEESVTEIQLPLPISHHTSRMIGSVRSLSAENVLSWDVDADPDFNWYEVSIAYFHDGEQWWRSPFWDLPTQFDWPTPVAVEDLWSVLGVSVGSEIDLVQWSARSTSNAASNNSALNNERAIAPADLDLIPATVVSAQFSDGNLNVLVQTPVTVRSTSQPTLAITNHSLPMQPEAETLSFNRLREQQPDWVSRYLPRLQQELQAVDPNLVQIPTLDSALDNDPQAISIPETNSTTDALEQLPDPSLEPWFATIGAWPVQLLDLNGNNAPDAIFHLWLSESDDPNQSSRLGTLIFSDQGELLFSDLDSKPDTWLVAIVNSASPFLVLASESGYRVHQWSGTLD